MEPSISHLAVPRSSAAVGSEIKPVVLEGGFSRQLVEGSNLIACENDANKRWLSLLSETLKLSAHRVARTQIRSLSSRCWDLLNSPFHKFSNLTSSDGRDPFWWLFLGVSSLPSWLEVSCAHLPLAPSSYNPSLYAVLPSSPQYINKESSSNISTFGWIWQLAPVISRQMLCLMAVPTARL